MMRRAIGFLVTLALGLLVAPLTAAAPATHARIAVLGLSSAPPASALPRQALGLTIPPSVLFQATEVIR